MNFVKLPALLLFFTLVPATLLSAKDTYRLKIYCLQFCSTEEIPPINVYGKLTPAAQEFINLVTQDPACVIFKIDRSFADGEAIVYRDGKTISYAAEFDAAGKVCKTEERFVGTEVKVKPAVTTDRQRIFLSCSVANVKQEPSNLYSAKNGVYFLSPVFTTSGFENLQLEIPLGSWQSAGGMGVKETYGTRRVLYLFHVSKN